MDNASRKTGLEIDNRTTTAVTLRVDQIDDFDWDGVSRPDRNIHGKRLEPGCSLLEREEINAFALSGSWFRLTFLFADGRSFSQRFDQRRALDIGYRDRQSYNVAGEDFYVTTTKIQQGDFSDCLSIRIDRKPLPKTVCDLYCGAYPLNESLQHTYVYTTVGKAPCRHHNFQCYGGVTRGSYAIRDSADLELAIAIASGDPYDVREDYNRMKITLVSRFGDCSGIVYGVTGVCHQMANRILYACRSHPNIFDVAPSAVLSYFAYGVYGSFLLSLFLTDWPFYLARCVEEVENGRSAAGETAAAPRPAGPLAAREKIMRELAAAAAPMRTFSQKALDLELRTVGDDDAPNKRLDLWIRHAFAGEFDRAKEELLFRLNTEFHTEKRSLTEQLDPGDFRTRAQLLDFAVKTNSRHRHMLECFRDVLTESEFLKICGVEYAPDRQLIDLGPLKG